MAATGIVAFFSALSAASTGANHSVGGMLAMLSACRYVLNIYYIHSSTDMYLSLVSFSVSVWVQNIHADPSLPLSSLRSQALTRMHNIAGSPSQLVSSPIPGIAPSDTM